jgi:hypothetical protein
MGIQVLSSFYSFVIDYCSLVGSENFIDCGCMILGMKENRKRKQ